MFTNPDSMPHCLVDLIMSGCIVKISLAYWQASRNCETKSA